LRPDAQSGRLVAFAATNDYLLLATAEEPLAQALTLLAGQAGQPVVNEAWYQDATANRQRGDLRLVLNMEALVPSPYFRSYWIQRNITELAQYRAGVVDLFRSSGELREERAFLRRAETEAMPPEEDSSRVLGQLSRLVPPEAGFYRAWRRPASAQIIELLRQRLLDPSTGPAPPSIYAPQVYTGDALTGSEAALETRIDQPPPGIEAGAFAAQPVEELLAGNPVAALLQVESAAAPDGALAGGVSAVALLGTTNWDQAAVLEAVQSAVRDQWTVSSLGAGWMETPGAPGIFSLDGLAALYVAARGPHLLVANSPDILGAMLARLASPVEDQNASFASELRHDRQRQPYATLMSRLDFLQGGFRYAGQQREPHFFSENVASLSETLLRVQSVLRRSRDEGSRVIETVIYDLQ
jgi:hypothetical protein